LSKAQKTEKQTKTKKREANKKRCGKFYGKDSKNDEVDDIV
jgi:hypothetical protein